MKDEDILSAAPRPEPVKPSDAGVQAPNWMGRPILHPDHAEELETHAAINEFGHKMPRDHAEQAAYDDYVKRQRTMAAAHHLAGAKAAHGAGDMEAARKHGMMYAVHAKALGHEPVGPVHPSIAAHGQQKVYKFKAHKGDMFALENKGPEGVVTSAPPPPELNKSQREALYTIWLGCQALAKGDVVKFPGNDKPAVDRGKEAPMASIEPGRGRQVKPGIQDHTGRLPKGWQKNGYRLELHDGSNPHVGRVAVLHQNGKTLATMRKHPTSAGGTHTNLSTHIPDLITDIMHSVFHGYDLGKGELVKVAPPGFSEETMHKLKREHGVESAFKIAWSAYKKHGGKTKKGEMSPRSKPVPCRCPAYSHPHRTGGGKCKAGR